MTAEDIVNEALAEDTRPVLIIGDPVETAKQLAVLIAESGRVFFNGSRPVRVVAEAGDIPRAVELTVDSVRVLAHELCRPVRYAAKKVKKGETPEFELVNAIINDDVAGLYLNGLEGSWGLRRLRGITTSPILAAGGGIRTADGYDEATGLWCANVPEVEVPERPTREQAEAALGLIRRTFRTFPFGDATLKDENEVMVVADETPNKDESAFLVAGLTAVARQSLPHAPGVLADAPNLSGAGTGKAMSLTALCVISSGARPVALTSGQDAAEFDKRLTAALIQARPCVFLDNFNAKELSSDILASALTMDPMEVRLMGTGRMVPLFTRTLVAVTGNGVEVSEDQARRWLKYVLDARVENPEQRRFKAGFLEGVYERRAELLAAFLTVWRWGQQGEDLGHGLPLGNYEVWARWVRDPLLALGCRDPVERVAEMKAADPRRKFILEVFETWWEAHEGKPVTVADLDNAVKRLLHPDAPTETVVVTVKDADGKEKVETKTVVKAVYQRLTKWLAKHKRTNVGGYWLEETVSRSPQTRKEVAAYRLHSPFETRARWNGGAANDNLTSTSTTTDSGVGVAVLFKVGVGGQV